jgi:hypothetical protein
LIAIITLFAAAYMSTVFVGKFGALGMSAANMVGGAVSTATGAAMGMAGGALLGGGAGIASRLGGLAGKGLSKTEMLGQAGEGFVSGAVPGAVTGFLGGGGGGMIGGGRFGRGSIGGMRGMGLTVTRSMNMQKGPAQDFLSNRAGSTLTAALYKNSTGDVLPTATPQASAFFMSELDKKSGEEVYNGYVANNYPELTENIRNPKTAGLEVKHHLQSLPPEVAFSNWQRAQNQGNLQKEGRMTFYQNARDEIGLNRETTTTIQNGIYTPNLEALDASPRFAIDTFNTGTVTSKGTIANAKIFSGIEKLGTSNDQQTVSRLAIADFRNASPEVLGQKLAQVSGVKMTAKEQKTYGHAMAKVRHVVIKRNPTLANNMAYYTMGYGKNHFSGLMQDEKFTAQAVKDMESQKTSAWLANTLNMKQRDILASESLFKTEPKTTITTNPAPSVRNTQPQIISPKQPPRNKPVELTEMQKREHGEGKQQW